MAYKPEGENPTDRNARHTEHSAAVPRGATYLGTDGEQFDHYVNAVRGTVWTLDSDGEPETRQDLGGRGVTDWIAYVREEHGEWDELRYDDRGGLEGLMADLEDEFAGEEVA